MRAVPELKSEAQRFGRHAVAVVEDADCLNPAAGAFIDLPIRLEADHLDIACIRLNGIVDQLSERVCGVLVSAVAHCLDRQISEEHTSELQSLMRRTYAVFCLKTKIKKLNY